MAERSRSKKRKSKRDKDPQKASWEDSNSDSGDASVERKATKKSKKNKKDDTRYDSSEGSADEQELSDDIESQNPRRQKTKSSKEYEMEPANPQIPEDEDEDEQRSRKKDKKKKYERRKIERSETVQSNNQPQALEYKQTIEESPEKQSKDKKSKRSRNDNEEAQATAAPLVEEAGFDNEGAHNYEAEDGQDGGYQWQPEQDYKQQLEAVLKEPNCCCCFSVECGCVAIICSEFLQAGRTIQFYLQTYWAVYLVDQERVNSNKEPAPQYLLKTQMYLSLATLLPQLFMLGSFFKVQCCSGLDPTSTQRKWLIYGMNAGILKALIAYGVVGTLTLLYGLYINKLLKADADFFFYSGVAVLVFGVLQIALYAYWNKEFTKYWQHKVDIETREGKARDLTLEEEIKLQVSKNSKILKDNAKSLTDDAKEAAKELKYHKKRLEGEIKDKQQSARKAKEELKKKQTAAAAASDSG